METCTIIASGYEMICPKCGGFSPVGSCIKEIPDVVTCKECGETCKAGELTHCDG